ncbi:hypothetical protein KKA50_01300, partial [Patescibacteria group bacterium]|nr:hypothetical protein [Patescibacteria group bacterium]
SSNASGWSTYVGANYGSNGGYDKADAEKLWSVVAENNNDFPAVHKIMSKAGIDRYKSYGVMKTVDLFGKKLSYFSSRQSNLTNINTSLVGYPNSKVSKLFDLYFLIFTMTLFTASAYFLYIQAKTAFSRKKRFNPIIILISLIMLGFFFSSIFFEVANRYAQILYPLFILTAAISIDSKLNEES